MISEWWPVVVGGSLSGAWLLDQFLSRSRYHHRRPWGAYSEDVWVEFNLLPDPELGLPANGGRAVRVPLRRPVSKRMRLSPSRRAVDGPSVLRAPVLRQAAPRGRCGVRPIRVDFDQRTSVRSAYVYAAGQVCPAHEFGDGHFPTRVAVLDDPYGREVVVEIHPAGRDRRSWTITAHTN